MPQATRKQRFLTVPLTEELEIAIQHIATQEKRTKANLARLALNEYVKNWETRNPEITTL